MTVFLAPAMALFKMAFLLQISRLFYLHMAMAFMLILTLSLKVSYSSLELVFGNTPLWNNEITPNGLA